MGFRVDKISVRLTIWDEGSHLRREIPFEYEPEDDDPLVKAALAKNQELLDKEAKGMIGGFIA